MISGEPWEIGHDEVVGHICCDCGLKHQIIVKIDKKRKRVKLKFYRDNYATEKIRKKEGIIVYRREENGKKKKA